MRFSYLAYFPRYQSTFIENQIRDEFSGLLPVVPAAISSKQTTSVLTTFFYPALLKQTEISLTWFGTQNILPEF
jgi:hypothetical protein